MLMSRERKYVFVEVPKTGTSAIAKRLLEIDPTLERDIVYLDDGQRIHLSSTHTSAAELRRILGKSTDEYTFIGFLRDPVELITSKYFYYKVGRVKDDIRGDRRTIGRIIRHLSTRVLPLHLWILIYPYKGSASFITDQDGELCIDIVGNFHHLEPNFADIFARFGYHRSDLVLRKTNATHYVAPRSCLFRLLADLSLRIHAKTDSAFFRELLIDGGPYYADGVQLDYAHKSRVD